MSFILLTTSLEAFIMFIVHVEPLVDSFLFFVVGAERLVGAFFFFVVVDFHVSGTKPW
jgi:hypothetical protein